jgi:hypothetical protein
VNTAKLKCGPFRGEEWLLHALLTWQLDGVAFLVGVSLPWGQSYKFQLDKRLGGPQSRWNTVVKECDDLDYGQVVGAVHMVYTRKKSRQTETV